MTQLKDVLHLYLGCQVQGVCNGKALDGTLVSVSKAQCWILDNRTGLPKSQDEIDAIAPILRSLEDMTEEHRERIAAMWNFSWDPTNYTLKADAAQTLYLLSQHFDLFDLIPSGQAINAKTVTL